MLHHRLLLFFDLSRNSQPLDVDVLDQTFLPAVDSPNPHGVSYEALITILQILLTSKRAVGMEITIFDPELDPTGQYAAELVFAIVQAFTSVKR